MGTPGYGLSDVALIVKTAYNIRTAYVESPSRYRALMHDALALETEVSAIANVCPYEKLSHDQQVQLEFHASGAKCLLEELWLIFKKYQSLGTNQSGPCRRIVFAKVDVNGLRQRILACYNGLHGFRFGLLENEVRLLISKISPEDSSGSDFTTMGWLVEGLKNSGITPGDLQRHREEVLESIMNVLKERELDPLVVVSEKPPGDNPLGGITLNSVEAATTTVSSACRTTYTRKYGFQTSSLPPKFTTPNWSATTTTGTITYQPLPPPENAKEIKQSILNVVTQKLKYVGSSSVAHSGYSVPTYSQQPKPSVSTSYSSHRPSREEPNRRRNESDTSATGNPYAFTEKSRRISSSSSSTSPGGELPSYQEDPYYDTTTTTTVAVTSAGQQAPSRSSILNSEAPYQPIQPTNTTYSTTSPSVRHSNAQSNSSGFLKRLASVGSSAYALNEQSSGGHGRERKRKDSGYASINSRQASVRSSSSGTLRFSGREEAGYRSKEREG